MRHLTGYRAAVRALEAAQEAVKAHAKVCAYCHRGEQDGNMRLHCPAGWELVKARHAAWRSANAREAERQAALAGQGRLF